MFANVLWLRADGQLNTVLVARLIVTTVICRFLFTNNNLLMEIDKQIETLLKQKYEIGSNLKFIEQIESMLFSLKTIRKNQRLTLRNVEEITGISNAYLSQLESGKIKNPSWEVVRKLFILYYKIEVPTVSLSNGI